jgi:hypothetical protein
MSKRAGTISWSVCFFVSHFFTREEVKKMRKSLFVMFFASVVLVSTTAQAGGVKKQVFLGPGASVAWDGKTSLTTVAGTALVLPLSQKFFIRPAIAAGAVKPANGDIFPTAQGVVLLGWKATKRASLLAGGGATVLFPTGKPRLVLATAIITTTTRIAGNWGIFCPVLKTLLSRRILLSKKCAFGTIR